MTNENLNSKSNIRENFFDEYFSLKSLNDLSDKQSEFLEAVGEFLDSGCWARNEKEKMIYIHEGRGYKQSEIAVMLDVTPTAYRSMVSRVSKRLREMVLGGNKLNSALFVADEKLDEYTETCKFMVSRFDIYKECPVEVMKQINQFTRGSDGGSFTEEDLFSAIAFLCKFSNMAIAANLNSLNPSALNAVISKLNGSKYQKEMGYFKTMQAMSCRVKKATPDFIKKVKDITQEGGN